MIEVTPGDDPGINQSSKPRLVWGVTAGIIIVALVVVLFAFVPGRGAVGPSSAAGAAQLPTEPFEIALDSPQRGAHGTPFVVADVATPANLVGQKCPSARFQNNESPNFGNIMTVSSDAPGSGSIVIHGIEDVPNRAVDGVGDLVLGPRIKVVVVLDPTSFSPALIFSGKTVTLFCEQPPPPTTLAPTTTIPQTSPPVITDAPTTTVVEVPPPPTAPPQTEAPMTTTPSTTTLPPATLPPNELPRTCIKKCDTR